MHTDLYKRCFTYLFEHVGLPDGMWLYEDLGYKNGPFTSPKVLAELIFPYYREMVDFFHGYDLPVVLHSCGSTAKVLPLVVEAGFDGLHPMERKADGNDPLAFAEKYGDRLCFVGGLVIWGQAMDRKGALWLLRAAYLISAIPPIAFLLADSGWWLLPAYLGQGLAAGAVDLGFTSASIDFADPDHVYEYAALQRTVIGIRGLIGPFLGVWLSHLGAPRWRGCSSWLRRCLRWERCW